MLNIERIASEVKKSNPEASDFRTNLVIDSFLGGEVFYTDFKVNDKERDFFYAFVTPETVELYDDGESIIRIFRYKLDKSRSILQRFNEFTFAESIGALIALLITVAFVYQSLGTESGPSKEFLGIFSLIAGYYFGRNAPAAR